MSAVEVMDISTIDLEDLLKEPGRIRELPAEVAAQVLQKLICLQGLLVGRLMASHETGVEPNAQPDRLLTVDEAAHRLGTTADWLYRKSAIYPFTVRNGRQLRFSAQGIDRWIRRNQGRSPG